ncbi:MAG: LacI family DNA-binding transcriptional regulator [Verrucomicrobiota bacterium]
MAKKNPVTLNDLAQHVGLAKSTVAFVMSGKAPDMGIAQKTVEKVEAAAKKLGYERNYWATSLARRSSDIVTVLLGGLSGDWGDQVMYSITQTLTANSFFPFVAADWRDPKLFDKAVSATIQRRDAGMICHTATGDAEQFSRIIRNGIPLVFLGDIPCALSNVPELNSVVWDDEQAVKTAIRHLVDTGRRNIAFVGADHGVDADQHRLAAYEEALEEAGLKVRKDWQFWAKLAGSPLSGIKEALEFLFAPGKEHPDALFALNHVVSRDIRLVAAEMGIRMPEDTALIGLGDFPANQVAGISTIREPIHELGEAAAEMLLELIKDPGKKPLHRKISCNELLARKTTAV